jgi:hypothetical protein
MAKGYFFASLQQAKSRVHITRAQDRSYLMSVPPAMMDTIGEKALNPCYILI